MPNKDLRLESKKTVTTYVASDSANLSAEMLNLGAILRVADAAEKMAQRHTDLINRNEYLDGYVKRLEKISRTKDRQISALRGHINKMKKAMK